MSTPTPIAKILADLAALDRRFAKYDAEGVGHVDQDGARARAALHQLGDELAGELAALYDDAGQQAEADAAQARQEAHTAATARYRQAERAAQFR